MNISESDHLGPVDTQVKKRSKTTLTHELEENSCLIPSDLIIEILLRLPTKSIARCHCVTKRWASLLRLPYFTELFLTKSSTRPRLLFAYENDGHVLFFSSHQPQTPHENTSLSTTSSCRMKVPCETFRYPTAVRFTCINGLVFLRLERVLKGDGHVSVICNPSTGQALVLPKVKTRRKIGVRSYFGYDPVEKQYKVLSMTWLYYGRRWLVSEEHQVLTLGGKEPSWRKIECSVPHTVNHRYNHVCIDGVLYYPAAQRSTGNYIIVCFDVRSEKFSFVKDIDSYTQLVQCAVLINYNGKLGSLWTAEETISGSCRNIRLRVLEDAEKEEWSERIYVFPDAWRSMVRHMFVRIVGVTRSNEIVFSSTLLHCLFYFNIERYTVVRVGIRGMEAVNNPHMFVFQDHVEDVKLMDVF